MVDMEQAWLLPALPAAAFVILALFHQYLPRKGDLIAVGSTVLSFLLPPLSSPPRPPPPPSPLALFVPAALFGRLPAGPGELVGNTSGFDWVEIPDIDFVLRIGFRVDQVTMVMLAGGGFVRMLVRIYSP